MQNRLIQYDRSIIVAMDVINAWQCEELASALAGESLIGGFKFGFETGLTGLARSVDRTIQAFGIDAVMIYDHQKAGNDIPQMGVKFAKTIKNTGCDAAILFPFAGPETQRAWTEACQEAGLRVLVGGVMTHPKFLVSEGGYIADEAPERIFNLACDQGVRDFVVPGTKLHWVKKLRALLVERLGEDNFDLYAPGFINQGGDISECGQAAGFYFHAIVGGGIYDKPTMEERRAAARLYTSQLKSRVV